MTAYHLKLLLAGDPTLEDGSAASALRRGGVKDVTFHLDRNRLWLAEGDRDAHTYMDALGSAIADLREIGVTVRRVEPDDFVSQAEIAERLGRSSESIRLLSCGARGDGTFPSPVVRPTNRSSFWRWSEVAVWAGRPTAEIEEAQCIAATNARLEFGHFDTPGEQAMLREIALMLGAPT